jgi:hypothetical protein
MTGFGSTIAAFLTGAAVAVGGVLAGSSDGSGAHPALVIDAGAGRDGRELVDGRLRAADAEVRLARTSSEASTDVRYFAAQGYRVIVVGPLATDAAAATGVRAVRAVDLAGALRAVSG